MHQSGPDTTIWFDVTNEFNQTNMQKQRGRHGITKKITTKLEAISAEGHSMTM